MNIRLRGEEIIIWSGRNEILITAEDLRQLNEFAATCPMFREKCIGGDPTCPCQDGDQCHYRGNDPFPIPAK